MTGFIFIHGALDGEQARTEIGKREVARAPANLGNGVVQTVATCVALSRMPCDDPSCKTKLVDCDAPMIDLLRWRLGSGMPLGRNEKVWP